MSAPPSLGRYLVESEIGRGSMGVVYRARDPRIDRLVALKTLSPEMAADDNARAVKDRFLNEGRAAGRLSHPGIVAVFDADEDPATGTAYLAMELVEGSDLKVLMRAGMPARRLVRLLTQVAGALDHAHQRGVIHRDVKPANILVDSDDRARLTDFGIARLGSSTMTRAGEFLGTPAYMSPEQVRGRKVTPATDVFSLGVILYEGLTGQRPFIGDSMVSTTHMIANDAAPRPSALRPSLPSALDGVLARALAKAPEDRYASAGELALAAARALESIDDDATAVVTRDPDPRRRGRSALVGAGIVALAGILGLALLGMRWRHAHAADQKSSPTGARETGRPGANARGATVSLRTAPASASETKAPVAAPSSGTLHVEISSLRTGVLVVRDGDAELGRVRIGDGRGKGPKMLRIHRGSADMRVASGRRTLTFSFLGVGSDRGASQRAVQAVPAGGVLRASVDVGAMGHDIDVAFR